MSAIYSIYTSPTDPPVPDHLPTLIVTPFGDPGRILYSYKHTNFNHENYLLTPTDEGSDLCVAKHIPSYNVSGSGSSSGHGSKQNHPTRVRSEASRNLRWILTNTGIQNPVYKACLVSNNDEEQPLFQVSKPNPNAQWWSLFYFTYAGHLIPPKRLEFGKISKNPPESGGGTRVTITGKTDEDKAVWKTLGEGNEDMVEWIVISAALQVLDDEILRAIEKSGVGLKAASAPVTRGPSPSHPHQPHQGRQVDPRTGLPLNNNELNYNKSQHKQHHQPPLQHPQHPQHQQNKLQRSDQDGRDPMRVKSSREQQQMRDQQRTQHHHQLPQQHTREQHTREQQMREHQMREQHMREQQRREQQMREQQMREQQMREQQMREQQMREQQMREQQTREQQMREQQMLERSTHEQMREQQMREQQMREQQIREQQQQPQPKKGVLRKAQPGTIKEDPLRSQRDPRFSPPTALPPHLATARVSIDSNSDIYGGAKIDDMPINGHKTMHQYEPPSRRQGPQQIPSGSNSIPMHLRPGV